GDGANAMRQYGVPARIESGHNVESAGIRARSAQHARAAVPRFNRDIRQRRARGVGDVAPDTASSRLRGRDAVNGGQRTGDRDNAGESPDRTIDSHGACLRNGRMWRAFPRMETARPKLTPERSRWSRERRACRTPLPVDGHVP